MQRDARVGWHHQVLSVINATSIEALSVKTVSRAIAVDRNLPTQIDESLGITIVATEIDSAKSSSHRGQLRKDDGQLHNVPYALESSKTLSCTSRRYLLLDVRHEYFN